MQNALAESLPGRMSTLVSLLQSGREKTDHFINLIKPGGFADPRWGLQGSLKVGNAQNYEFAVQAIGRYQQVVRERASHQGAGFDDERFSQTRCK